MNSTTININGQEIGLYVGYDSVRDFKRSTKDQPEMYYEADGDLNKLGIAKLIQSCHKLFCYIVSDKGKPPTATIEQIYDWVETSTESELHELLEFIQNTTIFKRLAEASATAEQK